MTETVTASTYDLRDRSPRTTAPRKVARPLDSVSATDLADMRRVARSMVGADRVDDAVSAALLACADATIGPRAAVLPALHGPDRGRALRTFGNVCRNMVQRDAAHHAARDAAIASDGQVTRPDRDPGRSYIFRAETAAVAIRATIDGAEGANVAKAVGKVRWMKRDDEVTMPNRVQQIREQSLDAMLARAGQMDHAAFITDAEDRSADRYAATRQAHYLLTAPTPVVGNGTVAVRLRDAIAASGRTLGRLLYDHADTTTERARDAAVSATGRTAERTVIRWTDLLKAIGASTDKPTVRSLKDHARALATDSTATAVRFDGADATAGRRRTTAAARVRRHVADISRPDYDYPCHLYGRTGR